MKFKRKIALLLFLHTVIFTVSYGQNTLFLPLTKLETKDGLSSPNVRKILQDKFGFMWFATQDGLNRFDGKRFTRYIPGSTEQRHTILGSDVYDLAVEENGNILWCLTAYGGLNKIDVNTGNVLSVFPVTTHPTNKSKLWFKCMSLKKNSIYIGTDEGIAIRFDIASNAAKEMYRVSYASGQFPIDKIHIDNYNRVWLMVSSNGIRVLDANLNNETSRYSYTQLGITNPSDFRFTDFGELEEFLLVCTSKGLIEINTKEISLSFGKNLKYYPSSLIDTTGLHCISTSGQHILIASQKGLYAIEKNTGLFKLIRFSKNYDDKSWLTLTNDILQSGETIWIGSQYGVGWIKRITTPFTAFFNSMDGSKIRIEHSVTLCEANDSILVVCGDDGLYFANHITGNIGKFAKEGFYYHAFKGPGNYIIATAISAKIEVADQHGKPARLASIFPELLPIEEDLFISSESLDDSIYFIASQNKNGLHIWNYRKKTLRTINTRTKPIALRSDIINRVFLDSKKRLWIVGDNTVSLYNHYDNTIRHINLIHPLTKEPLSINMDVCEAGGRYWIATYGVGVAEINEKMEVSRIYSAANGINNLGLYKIFPVSDSLLLASSNNGIFTLDINKQSIINYFEEQGLQSNNFEEASGFPTSNYIFLGGLKGFTKIDRKNLAVQKGNINLYFSSIKMLIQGKVIDTFNLTLNKLVLPSNLNQLEIDVASLNYENPEKISIEYKFKEDEKWSPLGKESSILLRRTTPGTYTLQVRAANEDLNWSNPIELKLVFRPKWNETLLFRIALILIVVAAIYGLYMYRLNQLRKEEHIRRRLASDLHDDLGSTLNSIKVYTNLATMQKDNPDHLLKIKESIQDAIVGIRDIIWVLDDKKDTVEHLLQRVNQFAAPLCHVKGTRLVQEIDEVVHDHQLAKEEKRNLYMILKESINNSIKYADCSEIRLKIVMEARKIRLTISDNGKGFDTQTASEGNGIKNMKTRAGEIGYKIHIDSSTGGGTKITLEKK